MKTTLFLILSLLCALHSKSQTAPLVIATENLYNSATASVGTFYISSSDDSYLAYKEVYLTPSKQSDFLKSIEKNRPVVNDTVIYLSTTAKLHIFSTATIESTGFEPVTHKKMFVKHP